MERKRGTCVCDCGGIVVDHANTTIEAHGNRFISCRRCYKVWDADYAFSVRPFTGIIELNIDDQYNYVRQVKKGTFL